MKDMYLKISMQDQLRMERILLDRDQEDALALIKQWSEIIANAERYGMQSHLDVRPSPGGLRK
jgi:hypothetical protein